MLVDERLAARFWAKVDIRGPDECWPWTGSRQGRGYGRLGLGARSEGTAQAHRVAYAIAKDDPGDLDVLHDCDNPPCCNAAHLFLGTNADNVADKLAKGRQPCGEAIKQSKLTAADARAARHAYSLGTPVTYIAKSFGVSNATMIALVRNRTWKAA